MDKSSVLAATCRPIHPAGHDSVLAATCSPIHRAEDDGQSYRYSRSIACADGSNLPGCKKTKQKTNENTPERESRIPEMKIWQAKEPQFEFRVDLMEIIVIVQLWQVKSDTWTQSCAVPGAVLPLWPAALQ